MASPALRLPFVVDQDGAAILDIEHDAIVTLNSTGGYIWERLQKQRSVDDIVGELANDTGANTAVVAADVRDFVEQLKANGLLGR